MISQVLDEEKICSSNPEVKLLNYPEETLEDLDDDEPLFLPFDLEQCWN